MPVAQTTSDGVVDFFDSNVVGVILSLLGILAIALILRWLWHRMVRRITNTFTNSAVSRHLAGDRDSEREQALAIERYRARASAVSGLLASVGTFIIISVALLFALSSLGVDIAPLLASAGIAGIAIGFGAQTIVRDFLSGVFMILENQYGVGDVVTIGGVGGVTGSVEDVGLRITRLRDADGTVWFITNGSVMQLGNRSQGWSVAVVDVPAGHGADLSAAKRVLMDTALEMQQDDAWSARIMPDEPIVGVESITATAVTIRIRIHTVHEQQYLVARELRIRAVRALDVAGISMPNQGTAGPTVET